MGGSSSPDIEETPEQKESARIAAEEWGRYQDVFRDVEDQFIKEMDRTDADYANVRNEVARGVNEQYSGMATQRRNQMIAGGVDPSSGGFKAGLGDVSVRHAQASADAETSALEGVADAEIAGKQAIVAMGQGQSADAQAGLADVAGQAVQESINDANEDMRSRMARQQALGSAAGMAAGYDWNEQ